MPGLSLDFANFQNEMNLFSRNSQESHFHQSLNQKQVGISSQLWQSKVGYCVWKQNDHKLCIAIWLFDFYSRLWKRTRINGCLSEPLCSWWPPLCGLIGPNSVRERERQARPMDWTCFRHSHTTGWLLPVLLYLVLILFRAHSLFFVRIIQYIFSFTELGTCKMLPFN